MRIGTASARRRAQLLALEPELSIEPLRGNVDTRLRKRGERGLDAIVLAAAGLDRLGLSAEIGHRFDPEELVPEAGQGAVALQVRAGEEELAAGVGRPRDAAPCRRPSGPAWRGSAAGCLAPVAAHHDGEALTALIAAEDGAWIERRRGDDPLALADELLAARRREGRRHRHRTSALAERLRAARLRRRRVPAHPHRADRRAADPTPSATTGSSSRAGTPSSRSSSGCEGRPGRVAAIGPGTAEALRAHGIEPDARRRALDPGRARRGASRARRAASSSPAAEGARDVLVRELGAELVPLYRTVELEPDVVPRRRPRRARVGLGGAGARRAPDATSPA